MKQSRCAMMFEAEPGQIAGYGLLRDGSSALYLGPIVAVVADAGVRLADALLARADGRKIFWDIPDGNAAAAELAVARGFTPQRPLTRMFLREDSTPGDRQQQFAIAGPEMG